MAAQPHQEQKYLPNQLWRATPSGESGPSPPYQNQAQNHQAGGVRCSPAYEALGLAVKGLGKLTNPCAGVPDCLTRKNWRR